MPDNNIMLMGLQPRTCMDIAHKRWALSHVNFGATPRYKAVDYAPTLHCGAGATCKQGQLILELWITSNDTLSANHTMQKATSPTTTLSDCGRASSEAAHETD